MNWLDPSKEKPPVVLISPFEDISSLSLRGLSAFLESRGFPTRMIFLSNVIPHEKTTPLDWDFTYQPQIIDQILQLCENSLLIGISVMTNYFHCMAHLTQKIKSKLDIPVIWGGIHPTLRPEDCLNYADFVCVGEGEEALLELTRAILDGKPTTNIQNIFIKSDGKIIRNPLRPLWQDLDALPFQDYDLEEHYLYYRKDQSIVKMTPALLQEYLDLDYGPRALEPSMPTFQIMLARGCPYRCTFCGNQALAALYPGQKLLRKRSIQNALLEIKSFREKFPFIKALIFSDDSFLLAKEEEVQEFSTKYKEEVNLPFCCLATPASINENKIKNLVSAGLFFLKVGIQTGSTRITDLYQRNWSSPEAVEKAAKILNKYKEKLLPLYDVILDNPFSTPKDELQTLKLILKLPKPYVLMLYSLALFPGSKLLEKALQEGLVEDEKSLYQKDYRQFRRNYINILFILICRGWPIFIIRFFAHPILVLIFERPYFERIFRLFQNYRRTLEKHKRVESQKK